MRPASARVALVGIVWLAVTARAWSPAEGREQLRAVNHGEGEVWVEVEQATVDHVLEAAGHPAVGLDLPVPAGTVLVRRGDGWSVEHRDDRWVDGLPVDLNRSSVEALDQLPGVGPSTASAIVAARPYASAADVVQARGIGPSTARRIAPWVAAHAAEARPALVAVNCASLDELDRLPRIGPALARRLVDARPLRDLAELDAVRGIGPATLDGLRDRVQFEACP